MNLEYSIEATWTGKRQLPICKIRIPSWVEFEWTGDWSKSSSKWSEDLRKELKVDEDENCIWMSWGDIQGTFSHFIICQVSDVIKEEQAPSEVAVAPQQQEQPNKDAPKVEGKKEEKIDPPKDQKMVDEKPKD